MAVLKYVIFSLLLRVGYLFPIAPKFSGPTVKRFVLHNNQKDSTTPVVVTRFLALAAVGANNEVSTTSEKRKLSRPERKALERARKEATRRTTTGNRNHKQPPTSQTNSRRILQNVKDTNTTATTGGNQREGIVINLRSSSSISVETLDSSFDDMLKAIKKAQKNEDRQDLNSIHRFLVDFGSTKNEDDNNDFNNSTKTNYILKASLLGRIAVAALHMNNHRVAADAISQRQSLLLLEATHDSPLSYSNLDSSRIQPARDSAALVRNLLRVGNVTEAYHILQEELPMPKQPALLEGELANGDFNKTIYMETMNREKLKYRAEALVAIAGWYFMEGEPHAAVQTCRTLASTGSALREAKLSGSDLGLALARLLQAASKCQSWIRSGEFALVNSDDKKDAERNVNEEFRSRSVQIPCNVVYSVLDVMMSLPTDNDDRVYEILSNSLVRRVIFVTGAVEMGGCPPADRGEAAFIGRSNVGKSSLVNMITNRKSLAYTSKRPGKTQQFNFFAVNDKVGREQEIKYGDLVTGSKDADSFYIVDLPGFGYAKVPEKQRKEWLRFMKDYISSRETLRVLFHLVDSRHGPTEEDVSIMKQVNENLQPSTKYVIVLTKADKNIKGGARDNYTGKVSQDVLQKLNNAITDNFENSVPVVLTSAESKLGRDEMWSFLRYAALS